MDSAPPNVFKCTGPPEGAHPLVTLAQADGQLDPPACAMCSHPMVLSEEHDPSWAESRAFTRETFVQAIGYVVAQTIEPDQVFPAEQAAAAAHKAFEEFGV